MKLFDLFPCCLHQLVYLLGSETNSPQDPVITFVFEGSIKRFQTTSIFERTQVLLLTGTNESHGLSKGLHNQARPASLLSERSRVTVDILEAIFIVLGGKLPDGSIVEDSAARQHVIAIPRQPVEDVFLLEHGGHLSVGARKVIEGLIVFCVFVSWYLPESVFDLPLDEVIYGRLEFCVPTLFEITENMR